MASLHRAPPASSRAKLGSGRPKGASSGLMIGPSVRRSCWTNSSDSPTTLRMVTVIRFSVNVPVLSEQMVVTDPSVSTAGSFRIKALRRTMRWAPRAKLMVTTAGRPSGTAATARLTAIRNISVVSPPRQIPTLKTMPQTSRAPMASHLPSSAMRRCSGVLSSVMVCNRSAMLPSSVCIPVVTTTALPRP